MWHKPEDAAVSPHTPPLLLFLAVMLSLVLPVIAGNDNWKAATRAVRERGIPDEENQSDKLGQVKLKLPFTPPRLLPFSSLAYPLVQDWGQ
jgi:hypothetical protein